MNPSTETDQRRTTGALAELAAAGHLESVGCRIIDRNARWREGELDIVALDKGTLVFVEVKALVERNGATPFSPFDSIGRKKQLRIRMLARRWMSDRLPRIRDDEDLGFSSIRFDAVAVTIAPDQTVREIDHLADAF